MYDQDLHLYVFARLPYLCVSVVFIVVAQATMESESGAACVPAVPADAEMVVRNVPEQRDDNPAGPTYSTHRANGPMGSYEPKNIQKYNHFPFFPRSQVHICLGSHAGLTYVYLYIYICIHI